MTPFEVMNKFNKKYGNRKEAYQAMQQHYLAGNVKKGLFSDSKSIKQFDLSDVQSSLSQGALKIAMDGIGIINEASKKGDKEAVREQIAFVEKFSKKTSREISLGTRVFGTWRNSLGVYKIDKDMQQQALGSLIPVETPATIFTKLPEWCVYMQMPEDYELLVTAEVEKVGGQEIVQEGVRVLGFWALHDKADHSKSDVGVDYDENMALNIMLHLDIPVEHADNNLLAPILALPLIKGFTVDQCIEKQYSELLESKVTGEQLTHIFQVTLSILLWLCVEEPDVSNIKGVQMSRSDLLEPKFKRNKKTGAFIPPNDVQVYEIGKRLGGEVRQHLDTLDRIEGVSGKRKRPHMRRGHWHGVWSGTGDEREFNTYWQSAIFVNSK